MLFQYLINRYRLYKIEREINDIRTILKILHDSIEKK